LVLLRDGHILPAAGYNPDMGNLNVAVIVVGILVSFATTVAVTSSWIQAAVGEAIVLLPIFLLYRARPADPPPAR
jgi:hypothetical protein